MFVLVANNSCNINSLPPGSVATTPYCCRRFVDRAPDTAGCRISGLLLAQNAQHVPPLCVYCIPSQGKKSKKDKKSKKHKKKDKKKKHKKEKHKKVRGTCLRVCTAQHSTRCAAIDPPSIAGLLSLHRFSAHREGLLLVLPTFVQTHTALTPPKTPSSSSSSSSPCHCCSCGSQKDFAGPSLPSDSESSDSSSESESEGVRFASPQLSSI